MLSADRLLKFLRRPKTPDAFLDTTRRLVDLSDEIAALSNQIRSRAQHGTPEDAADRERLRELLAELNASRPPSEN